MDDDSLGEFIVGLIIQLFDSLGEMLVVFLFAAHYIESFVVTEFDVARFEIVRRLLHSHFPREHEDVTIGDAVMSGLKSNIQFSFHASVLEFLKETALDDDFTNSIPSLAESGHQQTITVCPVFVRVVRPLHSKMNKI